MEEEDATPRRKWAEQSPGAKIKWVQARIALGIHLKRPKGSSTFSSPSASRYLEECGRRSVMNPGYVGFHIRRPQNFRIFNSPPSSVRKKVLHVLKFGVFDSPYIFLLLLCGRHICKPYGDGDDAHQFRTANERTSKTAFLRSDGCESDVDVASLLIFITFPHTNRENQETRCEPPTSPLSHLICNAPSLQDHLFAGGNATQSAGQQL